MIFSAPRNFNFILFFSLPRPCSAPNTASPVRHETEIKNINSSHFMVLSARAVQKAHWRCVLERLKHAIDPYSPSLHSWKPISNGSRNVLWRSAILVCKQTAERARKNRLKWKTFFRSLNYARNTRKQKKTLKSWISRMQRSRWRLISRSRSHSKSPYSIIFEARLCNLRERKSAIEHYVVWSAVNDIKSEKQESNPSLNSAFPREISTFRDCNSEL